MDEDTLSLLGICRLKGADWHVIAREAQRFEGVRRLLSGDISEHSAVGAKTNAVIQSGLAQLDNLKAEAIADVEQAQSHGARLITVLDQGYPDTLRLIPNLPPFVFVKGQFVDQDLRSIAVVGTRDASHDGLSRARRISQLLTNEGVVVVSGLARGIDTSAHRAALDAGGRTIAVVGTGILRTFPPENGHLSEEITASGALVSQFWPRTPPASYTFPRRNVTMSGIAQGTLVVEASRTSGAKMQARIALEHGKKVFLLRSLVDSQPWAQDFADNRGARIVDGVEDVVNGLLEPSEFRQKHDLPSQLELDLG